jgi:hypothetical protein
MLNTYSYILFIHSSFTISSSLLRGDRVKKTMCDVVLSCVGLERCQGPLCEEKNRIEEIGLRRQCVTLYFPVLVVRGARARFPTYHQKKLIESTIHIEMPNLRPL